MTHLRVISPAEFERARLAFVAAWHEANRTSRQRSAVGGERTGAGLAAALDSLGIIVATQEATEAITSATQEARRTIDAAGRTIIDVGGIDG